MLVSLDEQEIIAVVETLKGTAINNVVRQRLVLGALKKIEEARYSMIAERICGKRHNLGYEIGKIK